MRFLLKVRWFLGATILTKKEWMTRIVDDEKDTFDELMKWTKQKRNEGWDDMAVIGNRLYLRRFVERWPWPSAGEG